LLAAVQADGGILGFSVVNDILDNLCIDEVSYGRRAHAPCFTLDAGDRLVLTDPPAVDRARSGAASWELPGSRAAEFFRSHLRRMMFRNPQLLGLARHLLLLLPLPSLPPPLPPC